MFAGEIHHLSQKRKSSQGPLQPASKPPGIGWEMEPWGARLHGEVCDIVIQEPFSEFLPVRTGKAICIWFILFYNLIYRTFIPIYNNVRTFRILSQPCSLHLQNFHREAKLRWLGALVFSLKWFDFMENPIKGDDLGVPLGYPYFRTPPCGDIRGPWAQPGRYFSSPLRCPVLGAPKNLAIWAVFKTPPCWWLVRGLYYPILGIWIIQERGIPILTNQDSMECEKGFWTLLTWK